MILLYGFIIACLCVLLHQFYWRRRKFPPGPTPLPLLGNALLLNGKPNQEFTDITVNLAKKYGKVYTMWMGMDPQVLINDYDVMKELFVKQGDNFETRPPNFFEAAHGGPYGIAVANGERWREQRRFAQQVLRDFGVGRDLMEQRILNEVRYTTERLTELNGQPVAAEAVAVRCFGNIINQLLFGYRFEQDDPTVDKIKAAFNDFFGSLGGPFDFIYCYPWTRHLPFFRSMWSTVDRMKRDTSEHFTEQITQHRKHFDVEQEPQDFASAYLKEIEMRRARGDQGYFDLHQMQCVIFDVWSGGLEDPTSAMSWCLLYMIHYPEYQQKVYDEIESVVGTEREITMSDRNDLPFTAATIQEVQRRVNPFGLLVGRVARDDFVADGHPIAAGTVVVPQISAVLWDERYFPDPMRFDPGRFVEAGRLKKVDQLVLFSLGKRACIGESMAKMELFLFFANIVQKFRVTKQFGRPYPPICSTTHGCSQMQPDPFKCCFEIRNPVQHK